MPNIDLYSNWLEIDLGAIQNNARRASQITGAPVMAVVKANAYGHGLVPAAHAALRGGATWCAVARLEEALELRQAEIDAPALVLGYTPPGALAEAIARRISLTVWSEQHIVLAAAAARQAGLPARLHLKVDTGMGRIGAPPEAAPALARALAETRGVHFEGLFTHYARADEVEQGFTGKQEAVFQSVLGALESAGLRPPVVHAANSAAGLLPSRAHFDVIRLGIALYGLHPSAECPLPDGFQPALTWKAALSHVKTVPAGRGLSYNFEYYTQTDERIATLPVGYADGVRRARPNEELVGGRRVPVVGRVCMDQCLVRLDEASQAQAGDEVVLIGEQGDEAIRAEDVARRWSTNNYDVVCGIVARVPRVFNDLAQSR